MNFCVKQFIIKSGVAIIFAKRDGFLTKRRLYIDHDRRVYSGNGIHYSYLEYKGSRSSFSDQIRHLTATPKTSPLSYSM